MRIVLTGATGFVGSHLVESLAPKHEVICLVRGDHPIRGRDIETIEVDLARTNLLRKLPVHADAIIHLAQAYQRFPQQAMEIFEVNTGSTQRLAEYARRAGVHRFLHTSSGSVYRPSRRPLREDSPTVPSVYHPATKLMAESVLAYYRPYYSVGILRLFAPYGPRQVNRLIPRMISAVQTGQPVALSRGGEPRINPIYISDLVNVIQQALSDSRSYTVNVAGPRALSMRQMAALIGRLAHRRPRFIRHDADVQGNLVADTRLMHELFNLDTLLDPGEGLSRLIAPATGRRREE